MLKQLGNNPKMAALYYHTATKETDCLHLDNQMHTLLCYVGVCVRSLPKGGKRA